MEMGSSLYGRAVALKLLLAAFFLLIHVGAFAQIVVWGNGGGAHPENIPAEASDAIAIAAGGSNCLAIKANGKVIAWGGNNYGQCNVPSDLSNVIAVAAGLLHSLALRADGTVVAWGANYYGQTDVPAGLNHVTAISAGGAISVALKSDGTVVVWGRNLEGECNIPAGLSGVTAICAGSDFTLALKKDGTVVAWPPNIPGTQVPPGLSPVVAIRAAGHSVALLADGTVAVWGGQAAPTNLNDVVAIGAGGQASLAVRSDGSVVAWGGTNSYGELDVPAGLTDVVSLAAGSAWSMALRSTVNLKLTPSGLTGGSTAALKGSISLARPRLQPTVISLSSSDPSVTVPEFVTIPARATTVSFSPIHRVVPSARSVTITAKLGDWRPFTNSLAIIPFRVLGLTFDPAIIEGGRTMRGTVSLSAIPRLSVPVTFSVDKSGLLKLPTELGVTGGASAVFDVETNPVYAKTSVQVSALAGGSSDEKSSRITLLAAPAIASFAVRQAILYGHQKTTGLVTLKSPATADGTSVTLSSDFAGLIVPKSVVIPAGKTSAEFEIVAADVTSLSKVNLVATSGASGVGKVLTIKPVTVASFDLPIAIKGGALCQGTVTLNAIVNVDTVVQVLSSNPRSASVPNVVTIPAGSSSTTFAVTTPTVTRSVTVRVTVSKNGIARSRVLTISP